MIPYEEPHVFERQRVAVYLGAFIRRAKYCGGCRDMIWIRAVTGARTD